MLTVNHFEMIRRKVLLDGHSQRDVARELGHSRKTVAKALAHANPPGYRMGQARVNPLMDEFRPLIEQWMESDKTAPVKQRHTAQRMFERLRDVPINFRAELVLYEVCNMRGTTGLAARIWASVQPSRASRACAARYRPQPIGVIPPAPWGKWFSNSTRCSRAGRTTSTSAASAEPTGSWRTTWATGSGCGSTPSTRFTASARSD